jgi:hypothetical protein
MKASWFSDAQKAFMLKQRGDAMPWLTSAARLAQPSDVLFQLEQEVRRSAADRDAPADAA